MTEALDSSPIATNASSATDDKLVVVSNRLPTSLRTVGGQLQSFPSAGGLASALAGYQASGAFTWVGWPGCPIAPEQRDEVTQLLAEQQLAPVFLTQLEEDRYYRGLCNEVLWPLFHYFSDRIAFTHDAWRCYVDVNQRFADAVLQHCEPGTRVWVHDFHLMLVPSMLRAQRPDLEIGFFLHIPFPSSEIYRLLPSRMELLKGLLGADYIGFHSNDYVRHFRSACLRVLGLESDPNAIRFEGREIGIGANPIGIDVDGFRGHLQSPETATLYEELRQRYGDRKLILGVERLDYSKGVPLKLQAFERLLQRNPDLAKEVTFLQVLVPSRLNHPEYQTLKREIEEQVGRINGVYGGLGVTPVEYMHRSVSPSQLVALYRFAHAGFVAPVRDGMNLVAQEFVLSQAEPAPLPAHRGILILSEFAGAAHYLTRSLLVNPWNTEQMADAIEAALRMPPDEKAHRMTAMGQQVVAMDCHRWADTYLQQTHERATARRAAERLPRLTDDEVPPLVERGQRAARRVLALDYDGTLREIEQRPEDAAPTQEILDLLAALAALPDTEVHLVSGRLRETMQDWFGALPIHLCAEHGFVARPPDGDWTPLHDVDLSWLPAIERTLETVSREVPGTMVERKNCAIAWHYRMADLDYGVWRARELMSNLREALEQQPVEVVSGHRVVEVRATGVNKGSYIQRLDLRDAFVLCAGDDRTDLDMYRALPPEAVILHVGSSNATASWAVESPARLRGVLTAMCAATAVRT